MQDSTTLEDATTAIVPDGRPDNKTRRYDRQLRLWAASGQAALESCRLLVISASATSTSVLKNLVLPGIGHFTILDDQNVTPEDAGNNFFLDGPSSIGKPRASEAVQLLCELNEGVDGKANTSKLADLLENDPSYLTSFSLIIAHNLETGLLEKLSTLLWSNPSYPTLVVVDSAGFLAEFSIQFHEHCIIESHSENLPSLRIDKPFPALLEYATTLDFENMDSTEHAHIPYVIILVKAIEEWKKTHGGNPPKGSQETTAFKESVLAMRKKLDEENFEEAEAQAYRAYIETKVPSEISDLFNDPAVTNLTQDSPVFFHLVHALHQFTLQPPYTLPLNSTLPDMKANTTSYIHLQNLYKNRAREERETFKSFLKVPVDDDLVDAFVKNSHAIKVMRGKKWGTIDSAYLAEKLGDWDPKPAATHLALAALRKVSAKYPGQKPTEENLTAEAQALLPPGVELPEAFSNAVGEIARAPTADLPNTAAFLGGLVAQEVIKMITKQYIPINGVCVIDLIDTWTGMV